MGKIPGLRRILRVPRKVGERAREDVEAEVRFHLESRARELETQGYGREEALARALKEFGDLEEAKRMMRGGAKRRERRVRIGDWWREVWQDARHGWRRLLGNPGFSLTALLTLSLGIGATVAIFSVVNGVLLRPLLWSDPDRLVIVWENDRASGTVREPASVPDYYDFAERNRSFQSMAFFLSAEQNLTQPGRDAERVNVAVLSAGVFDVLGVSPLIGRAFAEEEDVPGGARVALLSESFWRTRFEGDRAVIGQTIMLDDSVYAVIGVMAAGVEFPNATTDLWIPAQLGPTSLPRETHPITVIARLSPQVSLAGAQADMTRIAQALEEEYPGANVNRGVFVEPVLDVVFGQVRPALLVLLAAVGMLLLIACANVASLLLARGMARTREVAVRTTLGASGARLARQFIVEGLLLTVAAALVGSFIARIGLGGLLSLLPADLPRAGSVSLDGRVLGLTIAIAGIVGIVFGLVPTIQAMRVNLQGALKSESDRSGTAGRSRQRARSALVVAEVAIAMVLVVGAGLLVRTVMALRDVDPGFDAAGILRMEFQLPESRYPRDFAMYPNWPRTHAFYEGLLERLDGIAPLESAAIAAHHPLNPGFTNSFVIVGRESEVTSQPEIYVRAVTSGYFSTLGVAVLDGRELQERDRTDASSVALINRAARERFFPDGLAIGQQLQWWGITREIVGIVENERVRGLTAESPPAVYIPLAQAPMNSGSVLVRTAGDPLAVSRAVRDAIRQTDPDLAVFDVATLDETILRSISRERSTMMLLAAFAISALLLALIGVHGILAYAVSQRRRELGVRLALGAKRADVIRMVLGQGAQLVVTGVVLGLGVALLATRLLGSLLFGVQPTDALTFGAVTIVVMAVALLAAWLPARRATAIDPAITLRID
jgi:putative ABC transport system permease protein